MAMTREEIMRLEGRELDAAVAEHVMGWVRYGFPGFEYLGNPRTDPETDPDWGRVPRYSTDIDAAWQVVEWMRERGLYFELAVSSSEEYAIAGFWGKDNGWQAKGRTAPEAICRAALLAVRVEDDRDADA